MALGVLKSLAPVESRKEEGVDVPDGQIIVKK